MRSLYIFILASLAIFCSCSEEADISANANDFYHLEMEKAFIPVWVRGNTQSNTILLYIQGGPGLAAIDAAVIDFKEWEPTLEKEVAIAYYDQRGLGNKQGEFDLSKITIDQYLRDLDGVVRFLKNQYTGTKVILFGHSFGGHLSYRYAMEYGDETLADGLISIAGPATHDGSEVSAERWGFRKQHLQRVSQRFIELDINPSTFQEALEWLSGIDKIDTPEKQQIWNNYIVNGFQGLDGQVGMRDYLNGIFRSSINVFPDLNYALDGQVGDALSADEQRTNILPDLDLITMPSLILAGEFDDIAPVEELTYVFENMSSDHKQLHVFEMAGHDPTFDQPIEFQQVVTRFVAELE